MYTFKSSVCRGHTIGSQWETHDLSDAFCSDIVSEFKDVFLILTHPAVQGDIYVDIKPIRPELSAFVGTLTMFLIDLGDKSLPHVDSIPNQNLRYVRYSGAVRSGYQLSFGYAGLNYPAGMSTATFPDVKVTREQFNTQLGLLDTHCLMTVNGLVHDCVANAKEAYVINGAISARKQDEYHVGIVSFLDIGKVTRERLKVENIQPFESGTTMRDKIRFTVEGDFEGKSVFLVMGGYLIFPETDAFYQVSDKTFALDLKRFQYVERFLESSPCLDLSSLGLSPVDHAPHHVSLEELWSDDVIKKYLTLSQSFFVTVDAPFLDITRVPVIRAAFPGEFVHHEQPVNPLMGGYGKLFEYWSVGQGNRWVAHCTDTYYRQYVQSEADPGSKAYTSDAQDPTRNYRHSQAWFLEISTTK